MDGESCSAVSVAKEGAQSILRDSCLDSEAGGSNDGGDEVATVASRPANYLPMRMEGFP